MVQNQEEIREEQEAVERQRWGCLIALITVALLAIAASFAAYLRHHVRSGALPKPQSESAHRIGVYCPRTAMRIA
jgi:ABC-type amino acid transport system permease subunit